MINKRSIKFFLTINFSLTNINLLASLLVLVVAVRTHSLAKSIVLGLAAFWALQQVL